MLIYFTNTRKSPIWRWIFHPTFIPRYRVEEEEEEDKQEEEKEEEDVGEEGERKKERMYDEKETEAFKEKLKKEPDAEMRVGRKVREEGDEAGSDEKEWMEVEENVADLKDTEAGGSREAEV